MEALEFAVGFGAVDITPPVGLKMCGALEPRTSVGTTDPLMAKSFVATDGVRRLAVVGVDIVGLPRAIIDRAIAAIEDYRASLGHVGISVLRDSGAR